MFISYHFFFDKRQKKNNKRGNLSLFFIKKYLTLIIYAGITLTRNTPSIDLIFSTISGSTSLR